MGAGSWITQKWEEEWNDRTLRCPPADTAGGSLNNTFCKNERMWSVLRDLSEAIPLGILLKPSAWQTPASLTISKITLEAASVAPLYTKRTETGESDYCPKPFRLQEVEQRLACKFTCLQNPGLPGTLSSPSRKSENKCPRLPYAAITALLKQMCPMHEPEISR